MKFKNKDNNFYVSISQLLINNIIEMCKEYSNKETGGILIGHYSVNLKCANIVEATRAPDDSKLGYSCFKRGKKGLKKLLINAWDKNQYYLGEWHFHPKSSPNPSIVDINQMKYIATSSNFNCPEPILLIIGQLNFKFVISIQIFIQGRIITLFETNEE